MGKLLLLLRTVRFLKLKQVAFRLLYAFRGKYRSFVRFKYKYNLYRKGKPLQFTELIPNAESFSSNRFIFLNKSVTFSDGIDWDYMENGKLWAYNLNYFDFLNQRNMPKEIGQALMYLFIDQIKDLQNANEPYPTSLRGINWIKFLSIHGIEKKSLDLYLYSQYRILLDNLEYHILGNHLLENGFSLWFGAYYFKGIDLYNKGKEVLSIELREQVLKDGAHFELSPMYHKIILYRLLDCYNLSLNNRDVYEDLVFEEFLLSTAEKMLGWLETVTFQNGDTPRVNDSTEGIAPTSQQLFDYARRLGMKWEKSVLSDSGYRLFNKGEVELFVDYGEIGPSYIPGHAHSDTFSFVLNVAGKPVIVDPGISTYDTGARRQRERSTSSHNTVRYGKQEQSEVWGAFRVGNRANVKIKEETTDSILGSHNGYKKYSVCHQRSFKIEDSGSVLIEDLLLSKQQLLGKGEAFFHFAPELDVEIIDGTVKANGCALNFTGATNIRLRDYAYAIGYNKIINAKMISVDFTDSLKTVITLIPSN